MLASGSFFFTGTCQREWKEREGGEERGRQRRRNRAEEGKRRPQKNCKSPLWRFSKFKWKWQHLLLSRCLLTAVFPLRFRHSLLPDIYVPADSRSNQLGRAYWKTLAAWLSTERKIQLLVVNSCQLFLFCSCLVLFGSWRKWIRPVKNWEDCFVWPRSMHGSFPAVI